MKLKSTRVALPEGIRPAVVEVADGKIAAVTDDMADGATDLGDAILAPGFIDIHCNGGGGETFEEGDQEGLETILRTHARFGTTALVGAINSGPREERMDALSRMAAFEQPSMCPDLLGAYLEGPYYNPVQRGAHSEQWIRDPDPDEYHRWIEGFGSLVRVVASAPELSGGLEMMRYLSDHDVIPAIAHTMATDEEVDAAIEAGATLVSHLYNAQSSYTRTDTGKHLGVAEMGLLRDALTTEIIPDGHHLTPRMLELIVKVKPHDLVCITTDAMQATGKGPGEYIVMGQKAWVTEEVAYREDRKRHAGSVLTMDRGVRNVVAAGAPIEDALRMASQVPARTIGVGDRKGSIRAGLDADFVVLDGSLGVMSTICHGEVVYERKQGSFKADPAGSPTS